MKGSAKEFRFSELRFVIENGKIRMTGAFGSEPHKVNEVYTFAEVQIAGEDHPAHHGAKYFYTSLLNSVIGDIDKTKDYLYELKKYNLKVLKPDLNLSTCSYQVIDDNILSPFNIIKGIIIKTWFNYFIRSYKFVINRG